MAGADETPNDRAGSLVRTGYYLRTSNLLVFSGTLPLPYYTLVPFFRRIAKPRPRLLSGEDLVVMRGEAATSVTGCEPTYPSGSPLPFITTCNFCLHLPFT